MSNLSRFLKSNKIIRENTTYPATSSLLDEEGKPMLWTIKPLTTKENDRLRDECTIQVQVTGKPNLTKPELDTSKYLAKMIASSVVEPNLNDKELQDSYGVMKPEDLIVEMIDNPGEYSNFAKFIQEFNGFNETLEEKVEKAKN
jgi:hypothetical protein